MKADWKEDDKIRGKIDSISKTSAGSLTTGSLGSTSFIPNLKKGSNAIYIVQTHSQNFKQWLKFCLVKMDESGVRKAPNTLESQQILCFWQLVTCSLTRNKCPFCPIWAMDQFQFLSISKGYACETWGKLQIFTDSRDFVPFSLRQW